VDEPEAVVTDGEMRQIASVGVPATVAILTALHHGDNASAGQITARLTSTEKSAVIACAATWLLHEYRIGCAEAMIPIDEWLQLLGVRTAQIVGEL
jgi:hypothetical protein